MNIWPLSSFISTLLCFTTLPLCSLSLSSLSPLSLELYILMLVYWFISQKTHESCCPSQTRIFLLSDTNRILKSSLNIEYIMTDTPKPKLTNKSTPKLINNSTPKLTNKSKSNFSKKPTPKLLKIVCKQAHLMRLPFHTSPCPSTSSQRTVQMKKSTLNINKTGKKSVK